jgi:hypothetical protein
MFYIQCPWKSLHTPPNAPKDTVIFQRSGYWPVFKCLHANHCGGRGLKDILELVKAKRPEIDFKKFTRGENNTGTSAAGLRRATAFSEAITKGTSLLEIKLPPKKIIIDDWFKEGDLGFIFAYRGVGKTWLILALCIALADGGKCGRWQVRGKWTVLYIDGEMSHDDDKSRISGLQPSIPEELCVLNHEVLFHLHKLVMNLGSKTDQQIITKICLDKGIRVLVLDNLGCLFTGVGENDADEWEKILPWLLELRRQGSFGHYRSP